jgi:hypothetical protein
LLNLLLTLTKLIAGVVKTSLQVDVG